LADVIVFGGTTEGRELAECLQERRISALVCVATEYGTAQLRPGGTLGVHTGGLDEAGMAALLRAERPRLVLDATHPYADDVSRKIRAACGEAGVPYHRVLRPSETAEGCEFFSDMAELLAWLRGQSGVIFSALGAKEASALTAVPDYENRVWLRILPGVKGLSACLDAGFPPRHIICMQGPFSREMNEAMFRAAGAAILLTKESGAAGGFAEKAEAARRCGMTVAVLRRPQDDPGEDVAAWLTRIREGRI